MKENNHITAQGILGLLAVRHSKDVFVPECKDGPTWSGKHFRLDAWVMPRSWTKLKYIGYEIKISRSDFLKDEKHIEYFNMCHELYFVAPQGIIKEDELSDGIGLLVVSKNGSNLYMKKKAKYREIETPLGLLNYIIMCRAKIQRNEYEDKNFNADYWKRHLEDKNLTRQVGHAISKKLKEEIKERCENAERENMLLVEKMKTYDEIKQLLKEIGIEDKESIWNIRQKIYALKAEIKTILDPWLLNNAKDNIEKILKIIEEQKTT